jgi:hypothetical protein
VEEQQAAVSKFKALAAEIAEDGFRYFVLLGMGGSSLCPEVFSRTFGKQPNAPQLLFLDSTDPIQIQSLRDKIDPALTLFCVSSKSGTTREPNIYLQYFFEETRKILGDTAGRHSLRLPTQVRRWKTLRLAISSALCSMACPASAAVIRRFRISAWCPTPPWVSTQNDS